ncbi:hypothetical protein NX722_27915 [Endozoicomonas gorgoniicola]|uniref:Uncharacterized protein n=1 Tax=Endozoicomonas gorgoniicola TaxID=1234144 RepID=A0ABT3N431_9GAMM|nr:hypothetical protein [Endozoicomonas gorgoniicola]MCW7556392.1 hypothetical protein [Endozoicomonas gorgoniicola]
MRVECNVYDDLFKYYDALQIGLIAASLDMLSRTTFGLFGCGGRIPIANYPLFLEPTAGLHQILRTMVEMDGQAVAAGFADFTAMHQLTSQQIDLRLNRRLVRVIVQSLP